MRTYTTIIRAVPAVIAGFCVLLAGMVPLAASAQGLEAKAAQVRLLPMAGTAAFAANVSMEASTLVSLEDAAWLHGAMAAVAKKADQKKALLVEQASLLELLGRYGEAAVAWEAAASTLPGNADAACLLSAAVCRLAAGEGELAAGLATAVGFLSPDARTAQLAVLVSGWSALARGDRSAAAGMARTVLSGKEASLAVAALLLARASTEGVEREGYDQRLSTYGNRPEVMTASPLLLFGGSTASGKRLSEEIPQPDPLPQTEMTYFQVGAFKDEANARLLAKKLEALGLESILKFKEAKALYNVYVPAGSDAARTVLVLKDAGYEAWAITGNP